MKIKKKLFQNFSKGPTHKNVFEIIMLYINLKISFRYRFLKHDVNVSRNNIALRVYTTVLLNIVSLEKVYILSL